MTGMGGMTLPFLPSECLTGSRKGMSFHRHNARLHQHTFRVLWVHVLASRGLERLESYPVRTKTSINKS